MILQTRFQQYLLPSGWSESLEQRGFWFGNIGALSDSDLNLIGYEIANINSSFTIEAITSVEAHSNTKYLPLTSQNVPFHNDGVYRDIPPSYILLYCVTPSREGGETLLLPGEEVVRRMDIELYKFLKETPVRIFLDNYSVIRNLLVNHPDSNKTVLFFIDPGIATSCRLEVDNQPIDNQTVDKIRKLLAEPSIVSHCQEWCAHDLLIIDNYRVLHGRNAYEGGRLLKKILILPCKENFGKKI